MRIKLRKGLHEYELVPRSEYSSGDSPMYFHDKSSIQSFLHGFMDDPFNMTMMRYMLREGGLHTDISRLKDHDVIDQLAWELSTGMIIIVERPVQLPIWDDGYVYVEPEDEMPFAPEAEPIEPAAPVEERVDPALVAQAETMKMAAQSGTPFCEV